MIDGGRGVRRPFPGLKEKLGDLLWVTHFSVAIFWVETFWQFRTENERFWVTFCAAGYNWTSFEPPRR